MCLVNLALGLTASKFKERKKESEMLRSQARSRKKERERYIEFAFVGRKSEFAKILSSYVTDSCRRNYAAMPPQLGGTANALAPGLFINGSLHKLELKCSDVLPTCVTQIFERVARSAAAIYHENMSSQCSAR